MAAREDVLDLDAEPDDPKRLKGNFVVLDTLNTHKVASLYETFPPAEAHRLRQKWEFPYTPKPGSWLTMAEMELSVLARQCLHRRIATEATLQREVAAVAAARNAARATSIGNLRLRRHG